MTKLLLPIFFISSFFAGKLHAQVIFSETFDNVPGSTGGEGVGSYVFPPQFLLRNVDNLVPNDQVNAINDAWERVDDVGGDSVAVSTSWYNPVGMANDFMWTPAIALTGTNLTLNWNAIAYDPDFRDGYEVRIMTVAPTGGTGAIGNQLTNSTLLLTVAAEDTGWKARSVSLDAYAGQTVYIGFRNNSNDMYVLAIDDIVVQNNNIVPIHSLSLWGNHQNGKNNLQWKVLGTDNRYDLTLQNSLDGTKWLDIYEAVYSPGKTEFSYSHELVATKSFYRVQAVNPSGKIYLSNTILVAQKNNTPLVVYPTIANDKVTVQGKLKNAFVTISDASGKSMLGQRLQDESKAFDVSTWPAGMYFISIVTEDRNRYYRKIIVRH